MGVFHRWTCVGFVGFWIKDNSCRGSAPSRVEVRDLIRGGEGCRYQVTSLDKRYQVTSLDKKVVNLVPKVRTIENAPR